MSKKTKSNDMLYIIIIILLVIIGILSFFVGKNMGGNNNGGTTANNELPKDFNIMVVDDKRCSDCQTDQFITQISQAPGLSWVEIEKVDFWDKWIAQMLKDENISALPAIIFSHNTGMDPQMAQYLKPLPSGKYTLSIEAKFNPFAKRSERGLLMLDAEQLKEIKQNLYLTGDKNSKITWLEYSDVNCHFCKKMETDETGKKVLEKYPNDVNIAKINYISVGGAATQTAAEAMECIGKVAGETAYNIAFSQALISGKNWTDDILSSVPNLDTSAVQECIKNGDTKKVIAEKISLQDEAFGRGGTPRNVIINNETGEYEILGWAYPVESFEQIVDSLK